ncbi:hypothetical protein LOY67_03955 [Pseudomonas sp. B21-056]|jgi:tetratricopeptide (TPR) repeat protein|uniref:hypothetical protein n=1 Tax=Pseudomonas sp. B21-056 TaxID=2895495 RepID=UPI0022309AF8|nr:hypothetical protein [Pseudomonas sp. B21-056]UZE24574.1 hypothetical protein LOY67_03955 [Pseudomonas sp. B21-056]
MFDFLLEEKNFSSLRRYIDFLSDLPDALTEIKRFSDSIQRTGHVLVSPPDAQTLTWTAVANESRWREIVRVVPALGNMGRQLVGQISLFLREFEQVAREASGPARRQLIGDVDPLHFTPINVGSQGTNRPPDVLYLITRLCLQLDLYAKKAMYFKARIVEVSQTIHRVFARFIETLALRLCACDAPVSKIEAYYVMGRIGLPNMQYNPAGHYTQEQRREKAREHLRVLDGLYANAISASNNLSDFCHRLNYFLTQVKRELQANDRHQSLRRARSSFLQIAHSLEELGRMADALARMSLRLKP